MSFYWTVLCLQSIKGFSCSAAGTRRHGGRRQPSLRKCTLSVIVKWRRRMAGWSPWTHTHTHAHTGGTKALHRVHTGCRVFRVRAACRSAPVHVCPFTTLKWISNGHFDAHRRHAVTPPALAPSVPSGACTPRARSISNVREWWLFSRHLYFPV